MRIKILFTIALLLKAKGGKWGAGIGSSAEFDAPAIDISGGTVYAHGYGGGAGIGGGYCGNAAGHITIAGGTVKAYGSEDDYYWGKLTGGAGIGGGACGNSDYIGISGGNVFASGCSGAAAIGAGKSESSRFSDNPNPTGGKSATIILSGGDIVAERTTSDPEKSNLTEDGQVTIGGSVQSTGNQVGAQMKVIAGDRGFTTLREPVLKANRLAAFTNKDNTYVELLPCPHDDSMSSYNDAAEHTVGECQYCAVASGTVDDHTFDTHGECVACHLVGLSNNADNTGVISYWATAAEAKTVGLNGRTLYRDNSWNTLCLPFSMTAEQVTAQLAPAALRELDTDGIYDADKYTHFDPSDGTLYLYFKPATTIEAGKPYLVKWAEDDDWENPYFAGVTIDNSAAAQARHTVTSADGTLQFIDTYAPVPLAKNDQSNLFLGAGDKLFWSSVANYQLGAFRAYFHVDLAGADNVRSFVLQFGDDDAGVTGITTTNLTTTNYTNYTNSDAWYTLDGRKIVNGQRSTVNGHWSTVNYLRAYI